MNCEEARSRLEAEPACADAALAAHVERCPQCATYRGELLELDRRLRAALEVPVPPAVLHPSESDRGANVVALDAGGRPRRRRAGFAAGLALAASVAGVAVVAGLLWAGYPRASLAADVVAHMVHEPAAWSTTRPLSAPRIARTLDRKDVTLRRGQLEVTYATTCWFRARRVPHLVVDTDAGPVTVMVLADERVDVRTTFEQQGYRGVIVPAPRGALAVLARDPIDVDAAALRALDALQY